MARCKRGGSVTAGFTLPADRRVEHQIDSGDEGNYSWSAPRLGCLTDSFTIHLQLLAMSAKRRNEKVRRGNSHLTIYPYIHPVSGKAKWRFAWKDGKIWRYVTKTTKDEAKASAEKVLEQQGKGGLVWEALRPDEREFLEKVYAETTPADHAPLLAFIRSRHSSAAIGEAVARFLAFKIEAKGRESDHLKQVRRDLEALTEKFADCPVSDIREADLTSWWKERTGEAGNARAHGIRGTLVMFWRWARKMGLVANEEVTEADKLVTVSVGHGEKIIWTPQQFKELVKLVPPIDRAWIVLQAFAGLRPEEAAPKTGAAKRGLRIEDIDWRYNVIRVPAEVSKTVGNVVPVSDCLLAWLEWAGIRKGMGGACCARNPSEERETPKWGKLIFGEAGWPKDALRHSYGSYRNALLRNLPQLAEEMRTSVVMLNRHYHNPRAPEEGEEWFGLRPM